MFNDNACFGNIRIKIRPGGKCLRLSFEFQKPHAPWSFCIKYVIEWHERRVRAITSAPLQEDGHLTVRPLGREFGSEVPSNLSGSSGPLSAGGWGMAGTRHLPGRAPGAAQKWQGAYAAPSRAPSMDTGLERALGECNIVWLSCQTLTLTSGHWRDSCPLLLPLWVPAEPQHSPFPGSAGVWVVFSWVSLPLYTDMSLDHHNFCKGSIFKHW